MQKIAVNRNQCINTTKKTLEASLKLSTHSKCNILNNEHLILKNMGPIEVSHVLDFLSGRFDKGHAYSTINSAKCAIATKMCNSHHIPLVH